MNASISQPTIPGEDGSPALALVNSLHGGPNGGVDHVARAAELRDWLSARRLVPVNTAIADADVAPFHALRTAIRELLMARIEQRPAATGAVRAINDATASAPGAPSLHHASSAQPTRAWVPVHDATPLDVARAAIAADAIDLACGERGDALLACGGPRCVRLLIKDHPRRLWCTPACGDRIRAARYYKRHRDVKLG